jgi:hypothetical protein
MTDSRLVSVAAFCLAVLIAVGARPATAQPVVAPGVTFPADRAQPYDASGLQSLMPPSTATPLATRDDARLDSALTIASVVTFDGADQEVGTTVLRAETPDSAKVFEPVPPVWVDQPTISGVRAYEALFDARDLSTVERPNGTTINAPEVTPEACPAAASKELTQPAAYDRNATLLPPGQVAYFYTEADSLVHCAVYRWDEATRLSGREFVQLMREGGIDPLSVLATYDVMFEEVVRSVERRLGSPQHLDPAPSATDDKGVSHRRTARWNTDDVVIDLRLAISRIGGHLTVVQYWQ